MIAVDTNLLIYASREDSEFHADARDAIESLHAGPAPWAVPWPCWHEYLAIMSHPRVLDPPTLMGEALDAARALVDDSHVIMLGESRDHARVLDRIVRSSGIRGPRVHDARIAAICLGHGVSELWSADRDFSWFPELRVVNPLVGPR